MAHVPLLAVALTAWPAVVAAAAQSERQQKQQPSSPTTGVWPEYVPISGKAGYFSSVGNHRFAATISEWQHASSTVTVNAMWRRSDSEPLAKAVYVRGGSRNQPVDNCSFVGNADSATLTFPAQAGESTYYIYYMPFTTCEYSNADGARGACVTGARVVYDSADSNHSCHHSPGKLTAPELAISATYQARAPFESFEPMEMPMTSAERQAFAQARQPLSRAAALVPEVRELPVRMRWQLPYRWAGKTTGAVPPVFAAKVQPGEHFTFQLAVVNIQTSAKIQVESVRFSALQGPGGATTIPASSLTCMNLGGHDFWGRHFDSDPVEVAVGEVKPLWVAVVVGNATAPGVYKGVASVSVSSVSLSSSSSPAEASSPSSSSSASSAPPLLTVALELTVGGPTLTNGGDDDVRRGSRLTWLDSTLGIGGDTVPSPYTPLALDDPDEPGGGTTVHMLGKQLRIGADGQLHAVAVNTAATISGSDAPPVWKQVLDRPVALTLELPTGPAEFGGWSTTLGTPSNMSVSWTTTATLPDKSATLSLVGTLDCTGYADWNATLTAHRAISADVRLTVPLAAPNAHFGMGLGTHGGFLDSFLSTAPTTDTLSNWLVFDFGTALSLDGFRIYEYGDGVHDPYHMILQKPAPTGGGGFTWAGAATVASLIGQPSHGTEKAPRPNNQTFSFAVVTARRLRWVIFDCRPNPKVTHSHVMIEEVEFHEAHNPPAHFTPNHGTAEHSIVSSSSGDGTAKNPAWQAVDGKVRYKNYAYGWDAVSAHIPFPPQQPGPSSGHNGKTWKWNGKNGDNGLWVGSTKAGLRLYLKGDDPLWQAGVPYDSRASPEPPHSWSNNGTGGILAFRNGTSVAFSSPHAMGAGQQLSFSWSLLVTPVRPFDLPSHFRDRWAQLAGPGNYTQLAADTVTVVNMHQGNEINPWINYPYLTNAGMQHAADSCHALGMKFSVYNTMRELSDRCMEYFPLRTFNETFSTNGADLSLSGGADWLQEHLRSGYLPAWSNTITNSMDTAAVPNPDPLEGSRLQDAAVRVKALSRWNNYYIAGIRQIMRDYLCDGIYLDEIAYDRVTMLRARKMLGDSGVIDHHSDCGGFSHSPAMNYMELYPFINRLWYGEGFNYDTASADYWLTEISGLPSGISADMLRYVTMKHSHGMTRYHYRGMLVGSAFRWSGDRTSPFNPVDLWNLWDSFEIQNSTMIGWWEDIEQGNGTVPVQASNPAFRVTCYLKKGKGALIAVADFTNDNTPYTTNVSLTFDWQALGLSKGDATLVAPVLKPFQLTGGNFSTDHVFELNATHGGLLLLLS